MPLDASVKGMLDSFLEELKKVKGKTLDDLDEMMQNQDRVLIKIGRPYEEDILDMYSIFSDGNVYGENPKSPDEFIDAVEEYIDFRFSEEPMPGVAQQGSTRPYRKKFDRCVKTVRKTVKARKGSTKESAAIAICTKSVLQTRGRTMKTYKKRRLTTQKLRKI